jgi:predicted transcriptional regulator
MSLVKTRPRKIHYLTLSPELHRQITRLADEECRTVSSVIRHAIKEFRGKSGS